MSLKTRSPRGCGAIQERVSQTEAIWYQAGGAVMGVVCAVGTWGLLHGEAAAGQRRQDTIYNTAKQLIAMRAQAEFIVVIIIAAIIVMVFYLGFSAVSQSNLPQAVSADQQVVRQVIETSLRDVAVDVIRQSEQSGGFLEPTDAVSYAFAPVGYWQKCEQDLVPDKVVLESHLASFIQGRMADSLRGTVVPGKQVEMDFFRMVAKVAIFENAIDVTLTLPVNVSGYVVKEPYTVSIPTRYGRIYGFGKDFVESAIRPTAQNGRPLEVFTEASLMFSRELPTNGALSQCGEIIFRSPEQIARAMEDIISYTLTTISWWVPMVPQTSGQKRYAIAEVNGKKYADLAVLFGLPDGFRLQYNQPIFIANTRPVYSFMLGSFPNCLSSYQFSYGFSYPAILRIRDDLLNNEFRFASLVSSDGVEPASCQAAPTTTNCVARPEIQADGSSKMVQTCRPSAGVCENPTVPVTIKVTDTAGRPLPAAEASFGNCYLGKANANGVVSGLVTSGTEDLAIFEPSGGYDFLVKTVPSSAVSGTYQLGKVVTTKVLFSQVAVERDSIAFEDDDDDYWIQTTGCVAAPAPSTGGFIMASFTSGGREYAVTNTNTEATAYCKDEAVCTNCDRDHQADCTACTRCYMASLRQSVDIPYIPEGDYKVTGDLREGDNFLVRGTLGDPAVHVGGTNGQTVSLNMYRARRLEVSDGLNPDLPPYPNTRTPSSPFFVVTPVEVYQSTETANLQDAQKMKAICGIEAVTEERPLTKIVLDRVVAGLPNAASEKSPALACTSNGLTAFLETFNCLTETDVDNTCPEPTFGNQNPSCAANLPTIKELLRRKCNVEIDFQKCAA